LAEKVAKLSKAGYLDAESIVEIKIGIASYLSAALPVRDKVAEATPPAPPPSPLTGRYRIRNSSQSLPLVYNEEEERQSPPPRYQQDNASE
jgi:hypothetical protein